MILDSPCIYTDIEYDKRKRTTTVRNSFRLKIDPCNFTQKYHWTDFTGSVTINPALAFEVRMLSSLAVLTMTV